MYLHTHKYAQHMRRLCFHRVHRLSFWAVDDDVPPQSTLGAAARPCGEEGESAYVHAHLWSHPIAVRL